MGTAAKDIGESNRRRSTRVVISIPVVLSGTDKQGQPFREATQSLIVNKHGAKVLFSRQLPADTHIRIENPARKLGCPARVIWSSEKANADHRFELVIEFEEPQDLWGIDFPPDDWREARGQQGATPQAPAGPRPQATAAPRATPQSTERPAPGAAPAAPPTAPVAASPAAQVERAAPPPVVAAEISAPIVRQVEAIFKSQLEEFRGTVARIVEETKEGALRDLQQMVTRIVQANTDKFDQESRDSAAAFAERLEHDANAAIERTTRILASRLHAALSSLEAAPAEPETSKPRK